MSIPFEFQFTRYLSAKKSVDDRALNKDVWNALLQSVQSGSPAAPLSVLEIGAGIGTMVARMMEWGLLAFADYTVLDSQPENLRALPGYLESWARQNRGSFNSAGSDSSILKFKDRQAALTLEPLDLYEFLERQDDSTWDLITAHAFLDLVDIPSALPRLLNKLKPGGWFYFTINYDGLSVFEPLINPDLDELILNLFHRSMDERLVNGRSSGDSLSGRHLFNLISQSGGQVAASGSSDWVVFPGASGYPQDEAYFLHCIIHIVGRALENHPELDPGQFQRWLETRHTQIDQNMLVYIAHQLDILGRVDQ